MGDMADMMRMMMEKEKEGDEGRKKVRAIMWPANEAEATSYAAIRFTFNSVFCYVLSATEAGTPEQEAAVAALSEACKKTVEGAQKMARNGKFPAASWFHELVSLKSPDESC